MAEWASVAVCSEASKSTKRCSAPTQITCGDGAAVDDIGE